VVLLSRKSSMLPHKPVDSVMVDREQVAVASLCSRRVRLPILQFLGHNTDSSRSSPTPSSVIEHLGDRNESLIALGRLRKPGGGSGVKNNAPCRHSQRILCF
jgi:hypothetical protein